MRKYLEPIWSALPEASKASLVAELATTRVEYAPAPMDNRGRKRNHRTKDRAGLREIYDTGHFAKQAPPVPVLA